MLYQNAINKLDVDNLIKSYVIKNGNKISTCSWQQYYGAYFVGKWHQKFIKKARRRVIFLASNYDKVAIQSSKNNFFLAILTTKNILSIVNFGISWWEI